MSGMENSGKASIREDVITMFDKKQDSQRSEQTQTKKRFSPGHRNEIFGGHNMRGEDNSTGHDRKVSPGNAPDRCSNDAGTYKEHAKKTSTRRFIRCKNRNAWKKTKKRAKQIARGKKTVLNLSSRHLSDYDFILLGKGLSFCPRSKGHDKIKLAE